MTRKTAEEREARRAEVRSAAEEDARAMLLAAGVLPGEVNAAAVQAMLGEPPPMQRLAYTVHEFCAMLDMSASTFYRAQREGRGPQMVRILGLPRILAEEAQRWVQANSEAVKPSGLARAREEFAARQHDLPGIGQQVKQRKPRRARLRMPEGEGERDPGNDGYVWKGLPTPTFLKD